MSRYIDADALKIPSEEMIAKMIIDSAPSIDIVFCKECKYERQCRKAVEHITHEPTSVTIGYKSVEWCSYGERKEK